jgi:hypothetical protein
MRLHGYSKSTLPKYLILGGPKHFLEVVLVILLSYLSPTIFLLSSLLVMSLMASPVLGFLLCFSFSLNASYLPSMIRSYEKHQ